MSRATALASRYVAYAMMFVNGSEAAPDDEELSRVLAGCVRAPHPEEYPKIRREVLSWRSCGLTYAEMMELEDPREVWSVTRGDLNRIAGRRLSDEEAGAAFTALAGGDVMDAVSAIVTAVIPDGRFI